jgi:organic radical activating enzyme
MSKIITLEQFPVVKYGCDTLYAIDPKYKHLSTDYATIPDLVDELERGMTSWQHPNTGNEIDFCITGGEPLLWQKNIIAIDKELTKRHGVSGPKVIQIETNGTKPLSNDFISHFNSQPLRSINWNVSPKLFNVSGEQAWNPKIVASYFHQSHNGCVKFVVNNDEATWIELKQKVVDLQDEGLGNVPIFVMPVGSSFDNQTDYKVLGELANRALAEGFHVSSRIHCILWGNTPGV